MRPDTRKHFRFQMPQKLESSQNRPKIVKVQIPPNASAEILGEPFQVDRPALRVNAVLGPPHDPARNAVPGHEAEEQLELVRGELLRANALGDERGDATDQEIKQVDSDQHDHQREHPLESGSGVNIIYSMGTSP